MLHYTSLERLAKEKHSSLLGQCCEFADLQTSNVSEVIAMLGHEQIGVSGSGSGTSGSRVSVSGEDILAL